MQTIKKQYQLIFIFVCFIALYLPFLKTMVNAWQQNPNYSHGFLIPVIALYLLYSMKDDLAKMEPAGTIWGLVLIVLACVQLIVAKIGSEYFLQRTSIIVLFFGISLFLYGGKITKKVAVAIIYLIFMIPLPAIIWNKIAFPLQLFSSYLTEIVISSFGMPIFREGNVLTLSTITLEVVDACSGIRSLTTMLALSVPFAFFTNAGLIKKIFIVLSAVPIAIFVNIVRLTVTAFLSDLYGEKFAQGFLHEFSGMLTFFLGLIILYCIKSLLTAKNN